MKIEILRRIPFSELEDMIRRVPLKGKTPEGKDILVYQHARIALKQLEAGEVNPTTFYLVRKNMDVQREIRACLRAEHGIDSLQLDGALEIQNDQGEVWTLTPPIVEFTSRIVHYVAQQGEKECERNVKIAIPIVNDGAHRVALARDLGVPFNAVVISGALEAFLFYAHPNAWDEVRLVDAVPAQREEKKLYIRDDCYFLYRDFGVLGCGAPRSPHK